MKHIIVEFSGWAKVTAEGATFESLLDPGYTITGSQYLNLKEREKEDFILQDAIAFIRDCDDNEWTDITVIEDES